MAICQYIRTYISWRQSISRFGGKLAAITPISQRRRIIGPLQRRRYRPNASSWLPCCPGTLRAKPGDERLLASTTGAGRIQWSSFRIGRNPVQISSSTEQIFCHPTLPASAGVPERLRDLLGFGPRRLLEQFLHARHQAQSCRVPEQVHLGASRQKKASDMPVFIADGIAQRGRHAPRAVVLTWRLWPRPAVVLFLRCVRAYGELCQEMRSNSCAFGRYGS